MAQAHTGYIMTLANSIIGVGILAMPFCFQKCGIILSIALLVLSNFVTRISCHYLLKSSLLTRKRSFEFLALYTFGPSGKLLVELCIIGYLIGTCIAYFVVIGDLGPQIVAKIFNILATDSLRTWIMFVVTILCIIPLGLLKNVDSLSAVCTASVGFYFCLVVKVMFEARSHIFNGDWLEHVDFWKPSGILQCLPIFSMALSCQMQLFEVIESVNGATLEKLNEIVRMATGICTGVYIFVGFFGYVAFCTQTFSGNILVNFSPSLASDAIKIGFVLSVAFSFPLAIFPCRASIYSLLYRRGHTDSTSYIPEGRFKSITVTIVIFALIIGLLIPSIELVIGLMGSTIGVVICVMFPASCFMKVFKKDSTEKLLAQFILVSGFCLMILGTYANLSAIDEKRSAGPLIEATKLAPTPETLLNDKMRPGDDFKDILKNIVSEVAPKANKLDVKEVVVKERIDPMPQQPKEEEVVVQKAAPVPEVAKNVASEKIPQKAEPKKLEKDNVKTIELKDDGVREPAVVTEPGKAPNNEINKDAIKKEEEVVAEEEKKKENIEEIKQAKDELKQTQELLEQVNELQQEIAKQKDLVQEKLGVIADKVDEIERKVNLETDNKPVENKPESIQNVEEKSPAAGDRLPADDQPLPAKEVGAKILEKSIKSDDAAVENVPLIQEKKLSEKGPILTLLAEQIQRKTASVQRAGAQVVNNTVYEPMSYKVGEVMNQESQAASENVKNKLVPMPVALLLNTTSHKRTVASHKANKTKTEVKELKGQERAEPDRVKENDKKDEESVKDRERENIESIRRDILEVAPNRDESTALPPQPSSNIVREKRNANDREFCVNWDMEKEFCRDGNVKNELLLLENLPAAAGANVKLQAFGRDLKSVKENSTD